MAITVKAIKTVEELKAALHGEAGLVGVEQGLQVYSKKNKAWTRAGMRPKKVENIVQRIFKAETEEEFKALPKLGLMFQYEGTPEDYKPAVLVFTESYEDAMRKLQTTDYGLVVKRIEETTAENDSIISAEAAASFTFEEETTEEKPSKKGGKK